MNQPTPEADALVTLWRDFAAGDAAAGERLLALHYDEVRRIARRVLRGEGATEASSCRKMGDIRRSFFLAAHSARPAAAR